MKIGKRRNTAHFGFDKTNEKKKNNKMLLSRALALMFFVKYRGKVLSPRSFVHYRITTIYCLFSAAAKMLPTVPSSNCSCQSSFNRWLRVYFQLQFKYARPKDDDIIKFLSEMVFYVRV